ncbi:hypothetical protein UFOVP61_20 [uncultured Caudovirales phage]|uniref:Uncharacterized protein n=1 Tax=uncultured Caudovirales phage TaxID=2100421 RepID=A0A6J5KTI5_9CAUD|nr:hypothetical protein UFOVP61_20 [uncultured Caudovirales phage]
MNGRNSKLLAHVVNALIQGGDKPAPPKGQPNQRYNHAKNLHRKLKAEWNKKPGPVRNAQRLGIIRTLVAMEESLNA